MVQEDPLKPHLEYYAKVKHRDPLEQMMYLDLKTYLPSTNLTYTDKTSMAHSLEVRVPFLDMEVLNLARQVPSKYKSTWFRSKILLKEFSKSVLPKSIVQRKKMGFGLPMKDWFLKDLNAMARNVLQESSVGQRIFNQTAINRWLHEHQQRKADHSAKLFSLISFELWCERFGIRA